LEENDFLILINGFPAEAVDVESPGSSEVLYSQRNDADSLFH